MHKKIMHISCRHSPKNNACPTRNMVVFFSTKMDTWNLSFCDFWCLLFKWRNQGDIKSNVIFEKARFFGGHTLNMYLYIIYIHAYIFTRGCAKHYRACFCWCDGRNQHNNSNNQEATMTTNNNNNNNNTAHTKSMPKRPELQATAARLTAGG